MPVPDGPAAVVPARLSCTAGETISVLPGSITAFLTRMLSE